MLEHMARQGHPGDKTNMAPIGLELKSVRMDVFCKPKQLIGVNRVCFIFMAETAGCVFFSPPVVGED